MCLRHSQPLPQVTYRARPIITTVPYLYDNIYILIYIYVFGVYRYRRGRVSWKIAYHATDQRISIGLLRSTILLYLRDFFAGSFSSLSTK